MKTSSQRRRRFTRAEREQVVEAFRISGVSKNAYAREIGISWITLQRWIETVEAEPRISLVPVRVMERSQKAGSAWPEYVADSGIRLRIPPGTEQRTVAELLQALRTC